MAPNQLLAAILSAFGAGVIAEMFSQAIQRRRQRRRWRKSAMAMFGKHRIYELAAEAYAGKTALAGDTVSHLEQLEEFNELPPTERATYMRMIEHLERVMGQEMD